jgi:uncharacterized membrane protein
MNDASLARITLTISRYGLLLLLLIYTVQTAAITPLNWTMLAIGTLPIVFMFRPVWRGEPMAHAWLCFLLLMYFLVAVQNMFASNRDVFDVLRLVLVVCVFLSSMMYVRWGSRARRAAEELANETTQSSSEEVVND